MPDETGKNDLGVDHYMGFKISEIWAALDPKITIPDWQAQVSKYAEYNDAARRVSLPQTFRYADHDRGELDLYDKDVPAGAPALIFFHGGGFSLLDKESMAFAAPAFNAAGIAYISPGYPLAPSVSLAELLAATQRAAKWIYENAQLLGIDRERIYVSGGSAGGFISAYLLTTDWTEFGLPRSIFKGGMPLNGVFDATPLFLSEGWEYLGIRPDEVEALSPLSRVDKLVDPVLVGRAQDEPPLTHLSSEQFAEAARGKGLLVDNYVAPGTNHFTMVLDLADPQSALFRKMAGMIEASAGRDEGR